MGGRRARRAPRPGSARTRAQAGADAHGGRGGRALAGVPRRLGREHEDAARARAEPHPPAARQPRVDELTAADVAGFVATLTAEGYARGTLRKTLQTLQMVFDDAGVAENVARSKHVRLPREEPEEINPPTADHLEAVYRLLPSKHRLPLLWLDWSGARVSSVDLTLVGDYDEPRRRVRLRAATTKTRKALWVELHPALADALEAAARPARGSRPGRPPVRRLRRGRAPHVDRESLPGRRHPAVLARTTSGTAGSASFTCVAFRGRGSAQFVGQRDISVTADVYSHVLADERELDYEAILAP